MYYQSYIPQKNCKLFRLVVLLEKFLFLNWSLGVLEALNIPVLLCTLICEFSRFRDDAIQVEGFKFKITRYSFWMTHAYIEIV